MVSMAMHYLHKFALYAEELPEAMQPSPALQGPLTPVTLDTGDGVLESMP